jgi:hypothetical protein
MSVQRGIHIFYVSNKVTGVPGERQEGTNLYWAYFDGAQIQADKQIPLNADIGRGASGVLINGTLFVHCTLADETVHQILFDGTAFVDAGAINAVRSHDRTATVLLGGTIHLFYKDGDDGYIKHASEQSSGWTFPAAVRDGANNPIGLNYGPAAVVSQGQINLLYGELSKNRLKMLYLAGDGSVSDRSPAGAWLEHSPAAVSLDLDGSIAALHHSNTDNLCYLDIFNSSGAWSGEQAVTDVLLKNSPGACVFGERIYLVTQGTDGCLWCQIYMGNSWMMKNVQMQYAGNPLPQVWYGPCAIAV